MGIYYHKCNRDTLWGYNLKGKSTSGNHGSFPLLMYFTSGHTCTVCTLRTLCMFYLIKMKMWYHPQELLWPLSIGRFIHHLTSILQSFLERWHPLNQHVKTSFPRSSLWPSRTWKSLRTAAAGTTRIPVEKSRRRPLFDFLWDVFRLDHWMECCKNSVCSSWLVLDGTMSVYHAHNA